MANLEVVRFSPKRCSVSDERVQWFAVSGARAIDRLPQIFWSNGSPWREANLWLLERSRLRDVDPKTVASNATALHGYAMWLESSGVEWWDFPQLRKERCLVRYRGALIEAREAGRPRAVNRLSAHASRDRILSLAEEHRVALGGMAF
jgi:hypothetical protein